MEFEINDLTFDVISEQLGECPFVKYNRKIWKELIALFANETFGEIRDISNLMNIPEEQSIRVAYVIDDQGPALRFLTGNGPDSIPQNHDSLLDDCEIDGRRCGYIIRKGRTISIQP